MTTPPQGAPGEAFASTDVQWREAVSSALVVRCGGRSGLGERVRLVLDLRGFGPQSVLMCSSVMGAEQELAPAGQERSHVGTGTAPVAPVYCSEWRDGRCGLLGSRGLQDVPSSSGSPLRRFCAYCALQSPVN